MLYLGGLMAGRGLEQLVDAIALVPEAQLVLLGDGVEEGRLLERAAASGASVLVLPPVPPELVEAYASSAAVGVSPIVPSCLNYRYSLPNKLFQYMAAGIPVVASDFRQVREVVEGSGSGVVVDTTRPEAIARASVGCSRIRSRRRQWARAGEPQWRSYSTGRHRRRCCATRTNTWGTAPRSHERPCEFLTRRAGGATHNGQTQPTEACPCADTAAPRFRSSSPSSSSASSPDQPSPSPLREPGGPRGDVRALGRPGPDPEIPGGLLSPLGIVNAGDGTNRLFIVEQRGTVRVFQNKALKSGFFLDLRGIAGGFSNG